MRGPPLRIPAPLHGRCALVGGPGRARGLYLRCGIDGRPCTALVDTGSTISLVRPGVFPGTTGALSGGWTATSVRLTTVTGQETGMRGRKRLAVRVGDREVMHEFWLPPFLPLRPQRPSMRFGCAVELASTYSRVCS